jgi:DNA ligase 1
MSTVKPMKGVDVELEDVVYPAYLSEKLDGIRVIIKDCVVYTNSMKPVRNKHVQSRFGKKEYNGVDGELIVGSIHAKDVFRKTTSGVMSINAVEDVKLYAFDVWDMPDAPYNERLKELESFAGLPNLIILPQQLVNSPQEAKLYLDVVESAGGEGLILRSPTGLYKYGRATLKQQYVMKIKFFAQEEFECIGFNEEMTNLNEGFYNERGELERSLSKEGLVPAGTLGSLKVKNKFSTFSVGTGLTDAERLHIWENRTHYLNKLVTIRYMKTGLKDAPRHPVFVGWRDEDDISK